MLKTAKQMRQVNSTHPAPEKEVDKKKLTVLKKKKKGKMNALHQIVSYTDSWQCPKLLHRTLKNKQKNKKNKNQDFQTPRFQV